MDCEKNIKTIISLMKSQKLDVAVHLGNPRFPIKYEEVIKVAIEFNNTSLTTSRKGSELNCCEIATLAKENGCYVALGPDSHFSLNMRDFKEVEEIIEKICFPKERIINSSEEILNLFLNLKKELRAKYV